MQDKLCSVSFDNLFSLTRLRSKWRCL